MTQQLLLPDPGEGIHEAEIVEVAVSPGDEVAENDLLFEVETDKAVTEIPAPFTGHIVEIAVAVGDIVEVGQTLLTYETNGEGVGADEVHPAGKRPERSVPAAPNDAAAVPAPVRTSDEVRSLRPVPASPATRALAKRLGVDLHDIDGTGPDGRIEPGDVQAAATNGAEVPATETKSGAVQSVPAPDSDDWGPVERIPLRGVRRATARSMETSWREIPHVTHQDVADITELEEYRGSHQDAITAAGGKLTITVFLIKAVVAALRKHPRFNASLDGDEIVVKDYFNIGVAVDSSEGLVVPVLRDADRKSVVEIARELASVSAKMRRGERDAEDFSGGSFTITNPGGIGGTSFTPIINHPQVAILGAARARWEPVVVGEGGATAEVIPRLRLPIVLAFDHRVNDGADAARFMRSVVSYLEDVPGLLLGL